MSSALLKQAAANSIEQGREESAHEQAKIGAAAERKRQEESADSYAALIESGESNGKAIRWQRRISTPDGIRHVAMFERMGAYGDREFLRLANRAAAAAVPGGWKNGEAVEAIAAEIVTRVLAKTFGRMPKRGSLGENARSEDPDFSYLVSVGKFCAASAYRGDDSGLAAEVAPMAAADGATAASLADLAAESLRSAESAPEADRYMGESPTIAHWAQHPVAQWRSVDWEWAETIAGSSALPLNGPATTAAQRIAAECGERASAVKAAIVCAIRPDALAAELAEGGYGSSAGAVRKAACIGRRILADRLSAIPSSSRHWNAADWRMVEAVAILCDLETVERERRHQLEDAPPSYKAPKLPEYLPTKRVDADDQTWKSPSDLLNYPSAALKH